MGKEGKYLSISIITFLNQGKDDIYIPFIKQNRQIRYLSIKSGEQKRTHNHIDTKTKSEEKWRNGEMEVWLFQQTQEPDGQPPGGSDTSNFHQELRGPKRTTGQSREDRLVAGVEWSVARF